MSKKAFKRSYARGLLNRYVFANVTTRMAWPFTRVFLAMGLTPTQVSLLSFTASLSGMAVLVFAESALSWAGATLLMIGHLWDHSDGQVARATGTGSLQGGLLDTIIDRWVEAGWILALALTLVLEPATHTVWDWPAWLFVATPMAALFGDLFFRWAMVQKDLYLLQKELRALAATADDEGHVSVRATANDPTPPTVTTFGLPLLFNRDVTIWMLFAATLVPDRLVGLAVFAFFHVGKGLEKNYYTFTDLRRETMQLQALLNPDYHK